VGQFPTTSQGLAALVTQPSGLTRWNGPYLQGAVPNDPWGTAYQYRWPSTLGKDYDLFSLGKDKMAGGSGDDADLYR